MVLAGRVSRARASASCSAPSPCSSALLITGGVGPWLPFQMIAAGWVGFGAGWLPRAGGRLERVMLAATAWSPGCSTGS